VVLGGGVPLNDPLRSGEEHVCRSLNATLCRSAIPNQINNQKGALKEWFRGQRSANALSIINYKL